jgi:hypothetical protein
MLGCKDPDKIPKEILSPKQMQSLLIDIHTLEGGLMVMPNAVSYKDGYSTIFKKHNTNAVQYEESMRFYQEKPHLLENIYAAVRDTFEKRMGN